MAADTPVLTSERFTCRPLEPGDEDALWPAFSSEEHMRYWSRGPFSYLAELRDYMFDEDWGGRTWIAVPRGGGAPVFRMVATEEREQVVEVGYILVPGNAGQGIARECLTALITHLFRAEQHHRIYADADPRNIRSNRLLEALGFTREAHLRDAWKTHIGWCDTWLWGLLSDEWTR